MKFKSYINKLDIKYTLENNNNNIIISLPNSKGTLSEHITTIENDLKEILGHDYYIDNLSNVLKENNKIVNLKLENIKYLNIDCNYEL